MIARPHMTLRPAAREFDHDAACEVGRLALAAARTPLVRIDLSDSPDISTAALARLVLLRRSLLRAGRDLRVAGLSHRTLGLYQICRLQDVLPAGQ